MSTEHCGTDLPVAILPDAPVMADRLTQIAVTYVDFNGKVHHEGELIVWDILAASVDRLFKDLFARRFPLERVQGVHHFDNDDFKSMEANNSSCFNSRQAIDGSGRWSMHAYGAAIDINPRQNPYTGYDLKGGVYERYPTGHEPYLNRTLRFAGKAEDVKDIFSKNGFCVWGGEFLRVDDFHHFQVPRPLAEILATLSREEGQALWDAFVAVCAAPPPLKPAVLAFVNEALAQHDRAALPRGNNFHQILR